MKYIPKSQAKEHANGQDCTVFEYGGDKEMDGAVAVINGRYPQEGFVLNELSEEMVYVISGHGKLVTKTKVAELSAGDVALVANNEAYYFEGDNLRLFLACTPAFEPGQHREVV